MRERLRAGYAAAREVKYELKYIDSAREQRLAEPPAPGLFDLDSDAFNAWALKGAIAKSELSFARRRKSARAPEEVSMRPGVVRDRAHRLTCGRSTRTASPAPRSRPCSDAMR